MIILLSIYALGVISTFPVFFAVGMEIVSIVLYLISKKDIAQLGVRPASEFL